MRVPGYGPLDAKIVIVGEAPGEKEELSGLPFVGPTGTMLTSMLASVGIDRTRCYITNVVKTRPARNDFDLLYIDGKRRGNPSNLLLEEWRTLQDELRRLRPNIIICLGAEALRAVTGRRGIERWRGSLLTSQFGKLIATYHPSAVARMYNLRSIVDLDLRRAAYESTTRELVLPAHKFTLNPSFDQVMDVLRTHHPKMSADIETTDRLVRCLGLAWSESEAMVIPFISHSRNLQVGPSTTLFLDADHSTQMNSHWSLEEERIILGELDRVFLDPSVSWILQNFPFDATVLGREFGLEIRNFTFDTMVGAHCCYSELPKGLDFLCSIHTRVPYYSEYNAGVDLDTWKYCAYDAAVTWEIEGKIRAELREFGLEEYYENQIHPQIKTLTCMSNRGFPVDLAAREARAVVIEAELGVMGAKLNAITGVEFNPRSWVQKQELLYKTWGLPIQWKGRGDDKKITTDKNAVETLIRKAPEKAELLNLLKDYSEKATLLSSFLRKDLGQSGRFYTSFNITGTENGRLSSSKPLWDPGGNIQNIPIKTASGKYFRRIFLSEGPGWEIIKADLSQAQFWIVVWLARIERLIHRYNSDSSFDIHRWVASLIYRKLEAEIQKDERDIAKNGVYGGSFRMWYVRAAQVYKLELSLAKWVLDEYHRAIPEISQWWSEVEAVLNARRRLISPLGGHRIFMDRLDNELYRSGYACLPQMIESQILGRSLHLAHETFDFVECYPLGQVHDEGVYMCRKELVPVYARRIKTLMEYPIDFRPYYDYVGEVLGRSELGHDLPPLTIHAEVSHGMNWRDQEKI